MKNYYARNCLFAAAGLAVAAFFSWLILALAQVVLSNVVVTPADVDIAAWVQEFASTGTVVVIWSSLIVVLWHLVALSKSGRSADLRPWWYAFWIASVLGGFAISAKFTPPAQSGRDWAFVLALLAAGLGYWAGTVWCSPASSKYAPVGSGFLRRW